MITDKELETMAYKRLNALGQLTGDNIARCLPAVMIAMREAYDRGREDMRDCVLEAMGRDDERTV